MQDESKQLIWLGNNTGFHHSKDTEILSGEERIGNVNVSLLHFLLLADDAYLRYDMGTVWGATDLPVIGIRKNYLCL